MPFDPDDERAIVPCCGQPMCYCECNPWQRDYALIMQAVAEECPPAPPLPRIEWTHNGGAPQWWCTVCHDGGGMGGSDPRDADRHMAEAHPRCNDPRPF